jgi:hypothetical protein
MFKKILMSSWPEMEKIKILHKTDFFESILLKYEIDFASDEQDV